ncbi:MAG: M81 family metallopeptidase [Proteobacteria bacterium]|nr:M81 family metallopeptidase [Pseudomonadota bacterium]
MKIFTACLGTETHTDAPLPTDLAAFESSHLVRNGAHGDNPHMFGAPLVIWRQHAKAKGWQVAEGLSAFATPSGIVVRKVYEDLRNEILDALRAAMPVDAVMLSLHGAMVADGYDNGEGDLVLEIRKIVGPKVPIAAELDLHCHIARALIDNLVAVVIYKEYPHIDFRERAEELWQIMEAALEGRAKPVISIFDCRMVGLYHTTRQPMRGFVELMTALEGKDGVLSVSLGHGFPWGDVPEEGTRVVVVTDDRKAAGDVLAEKLGRELWAMRDEITPRYVDMETAITEALSCKKGPAVIADMADNPGGGGPGDSTFIVKRMLERGIGMAAVGGIWDPVATGICLGAGEGARIPLRLGGKTGPTSGDPLDLEVEVKKIVRNATVKGLGGAPRVIGDACWVHAEGIDFVIHSARSQNVTPDFFEKLGIDPKSKRILVVKSMQHFHAGYAPIAEKIIYTAAPGTLIWDMAKLPYKKIARPVWPIDADPWASNAERPW